MPREAVARGGAGRLELREFQEPPLEPGHLRLRSEFGATKHGTELAILKGYAAARGAYDPELKLFTGGGAATPPEAASVGNMVVGRVSELNGVAQGLQVGDLVLSYGSLRESHVRQATPRVSGDGKVLVKVPQGLAWQSAVCLDPAAFALGALRDGDLCAGDAAAIFGLGAIGLMAVQWAKISGACPVIAVDPVGPRRSLAAKMGAEVVLDPASCDAGLEIKKATESRGADVVIEYSGSRSALQSALRGVAYGGTVVCGAFPPPYAEGLDFGAEAHVNLPRIVFSRACSQPDRDHPRWDEARIWRTAWRMICEGRLRGEDIVSPVVTFDDLPSVFPRVMSDPSFGLKLGVRFSQA